VPAEVALVWDWESYWALELDWRPSIDLRFRERVDAYYAALWREHVTVDFVHPEADLSAYKVIVAPSLYLLGESGAKNLHEYVTGGGTLLVSYFSGIVDEHDTVPVGPYPGGLRDTLGLWVEEFHPLRDGEVVALGGGGHGRVWSEHVHLAGAEQVVAFAGGPDAGRPAITRYDLGAGRAWYVATAPDELRGLLAGVLTAAGVDRPSGTPHGLPDGVEAVRRGEHLFLVNHTDAEVTAVDLTIPAGGVAILPSR